MPNWAPRSGEDQPEPLQVIVIVDMDRLSARAATRQSARATRQQQQIEAAGRGRWWEWVGRRTGRGPGWVGGRQKAGGRGASRGGRPAKSEL